MSIPSISEMLIFLIMAGTIFGGTFVMIRFIMWTIRTGQEKALRKANKRSVN